MEVLSAIILLAMTVMALLLALPSCEIIDGLKLKLSLKIVTMNYFRNIIKTLSISNGENLAFHLVMALGLCSLGFAIFTTNTTIIMTFLSIAAVMVIVKEILYKEEFLNNQKINNYLVISGMLLLSLIVCIESGKYLIILPVLNLWVLSIIQSNKNKYHFEMKPSNIFTEKMIYYFSLLIQKIILIKEYYGDYDLLGMILISSLVFVAEVYLLELLTTSAIVSRNSFKKVRTSQKLSLVIIFGIILKTWNNG